MKVYGQLERAQIENLAADPTGAALVAGRIWRRTDTNELRYYDGTAVRVVLEKDLAQVITAKDIDGGTASNTSRITLPKDTTANLNALTRKQGTLLWDTTLNALRGDDGAAIPTIGGATNISGLMENIGISASAAAGALTVNLLDAAGATPSGSSAVRIAFLDSTLTSGLYVNQSVSAALSLVVPSGATLGFVDGDNAKVHVYALDNSGTVKLAVAGKRVFDEKDVHTTVAIDATADDGEILYSDAVYTAKSIRYIGVACVEPITIAGTWIAPTRVRVNQQDHTKNKIQTKVLTVDIFGTADTDFLEFTNLVVGKTYRYSGQVRVNQDVGDAVCFVLIKEGATTVKKLTFGSGVVPSENTGHQAGFEHTFVATETTIKMTTNGFSASSFVDHDPGGTDATWATIEELNNYEVVSEF